jgi:hypothetical protein
MAITEVGTPHQSSGYGSAVSNTHGITIAAGDVVVYFLVYPTNQTVTDNNGDYAFTEDLRRNLSSTSMYGGFWTRTAGASEPAAYAFTLSSSDYNWTSMVRVFRGVDNDNHWDDVSGTTWASSEVTGTTRAAASITTNYDNALAIAAFVCSGTTQTFTDIDNGFGAGLANNAANLTCATYTKTITPAGATGITTVTFSPSWTNWSGGGHVALRAYTEPPPAFTGVRVTHHITA